MRNFDYGAEAELFPGQARASRQQLVRYRRFPRAADAICFAIEELPLESLAGAALEVGEERFDGRAIRQLYESSDYPLARRERDPSSITHRADGGQLPTLGAKARARGTELSSGVPRTSRGAKRSK